MDQKRAAREFSQGCGHGPRAAWRANVGWKDEAMMLGFART
jgi:hypothetical protein